MGQSSDRRNFSVMIMVLVLYYENLGNGCFNVSYSKLLYLLLYFVLSVSK